MNHDHETDWVDQTHLLSAWHDLAFLYRVRDASKAIIYVGKTTQPLEVRFLGHHSWGSGRPGPAAWLAEATSAESLAVSRSELGDRERAEIHRWHPVHNKRCPLCSQRDSNPLYSLWCGLNYRYRPRLHVPWRDLNEFTRDVLTSIGARPEGAHFRLIDPQGRVEPGNICWGRPGPYKNN